MASDREPLASENRTAGEPRRVSVLYTGRVQGVGFRYISSRVARRFELTGFVRNQSDGSVRLVAEGPSEQIERCLDVIAAEMKPFIRDAQVVYSPATGEFESFSIRF